MSINIVKAKRIVDTILFYVFCALIGTGLGMEFGFGENELHFPLAVAFILLVLCHIFLSRKWIMSVLAGDSRNRIIGGGVVGLVVILFFMLMSEGEEKDGKHESHEGMEHAQVHVDDRD